MPTIWVVAYRDTDGRVPLVEWLDGLPSKARAKCAVRIERLADLGHELGRPMAAYLGNGLYELRAQHQRLNLRMLFFFHDRTAVVLTQGFAKQQARVPGSELRLALLRKRAFESSPLDHTAEEELE